MLNFRDYTIAKKLTWMNMLVSGAALLLACLAFFGYDLYTFRANTVRNLSLEAEIIGYNTVSALLFDDPQSAEKTLSALAKAPNITSAAVYTPTGQLFARYTRNASQEPFRFRSLPEGQMQAHWFESGQMLLVKPIWSDGKRIGFVYLRSDLQAINDRLKSCTVITIAVLLISLLAALLVSKISHRVISDPIVRLAQTARKVSQVRDYSIRAAVTGCRDEISTLIEAFNEMLGQIQQRDSALLQAHGDLEKRVEDRTIELAAANKQLEIRNREVERATQLKSSFLANMSHELRTPLNAIVGFSDLLGEQAAGQLNSKQMRFVQHIKQGSTHLLQLINDILDLSKIEAGQLEFRYEDFEIKDTLPEVLSTIRPLAMAKNIGISEHLKGELTIHADRVRFKQVLYNLLSNAVKFTPKNGSIGIKSFQEGPAVYLSVTDTGIGIKPEDHAMVFEEFRQVEGSTSTHQGTGLGLAITKRLLEQQGGAISLHSELGNGSCFTVSLPAGKRESPIPVDTLPVPVIADAGGSGHDPLILIVDDELAARELLTSYLSPTCRVATAESGAEALSKAIQLKPDAIVLDVLMAKGNGFETLVALRKAPKTADVPVIILSIIDQKQIGFALGATDYLIKPIPKAILIKTIRKYVSPRPIEDSSLLLVDDDPRSLELLEETLRSAGYKAQSVRTGARALDILSTTKVKAVLLDLLMPGMDGFQVIQHIRDQEKFQNLPIFVMTGKNLTEEERATLASQTQALFLKNNAWQKQLVAEITRVLNNPKRAYAAGR